MKFIDNKVAGLKLYLYFKSSKKRPMKLNQEVTDRLMKKNGTPRNTLYYP